MSKREPGLLLAIPHAACGKIGRYLAGLDQAAFLADEKTIDAVVRNLEIVGEAVKQLPADFKERHPHVPWRQIEGLRNRIVHDYVGVAAAGTPRSLSPAVADLIDSLMLLVHPSGFPSMSRLGSPLHSRYTYG